MVLGVPGRLRPRIISTFGTTRVVGRQPNAPAAFTPGEIPGTHFQRLSWPRGTWFCWKDPRKKPQVTQLGINPGTDRLIAQRLNHYATPGPRIVVYPYYLLSIPFKVPDGLICTFSSAKTYPKFLSLSLEISIYVPKSGRIVNFKKKLNLNCLCYS
jgi:hypothetical protein